MCQKPKILFLLHLPPPIHGSSIVGQNIRNDVVINESFDCSYLNLLASRHVTETGEINFRKIFDFIATLGKAFRLLTNNRPRLCYLALTVSGAALYRDLILVTLLKIFSVKRLFHLHNKGVSLHKSKIINRIAYRYIFKNADVIILSNHLYPDIQEFVPKSRVHICPNGVADETKCIEQVKISKRIKPEFSVVNILFLSNLIESKGVFVLLEALALLKQKKVLFKCVFIGSEGNISRSQFDERKNKLSLNGLVSYEGKKYGAAKKHAFSKADIFAFPTYYKNECFPLVLLEAMSYSLPIISTFEGGIKDIVEDGITGFLVPQNDIYTLAASLERLIVNPQLSIQMGQAGRIKYEKEFTKEKFEIRLVEIIKDVVEK